MCTESSTCRVTHALGVTTYLCASILSNFEMTNERGKRGGRMGSKVARGGAKGE